MSTMNTEEAYKVEPLQGSANYRTWKFSLRMVLQARDLWEVVSGEEPKPEIEKGAQAWEKKARKALATIALALSAAEKEDHRVHSPESSMGCSGEIVWRERTESQIHATPRIVQDVDGRGNHGFIFASYQRQNVGAINNWSQVRGRHQTGHHPQQFTRTLSISRC